VAERVEEGRGEPVAVAAPANRPVAIAIAAPAPAIPRARPIQGERLIATMLRVGGLAGGACFALSIVLHVASAPHRLDVPVDLLRKAGASLLIVTPVARLGIAGALLGSKGEWRYLAYAAAIIALLGVALGAGLNA